MYTRDERRDGRIVELLNTGMIGLGRLAAMENEAQVEEMVPVGTNNTANEVVLDFEDDVRTSQQHMFAFVFLQPQSMMRKGVGSGGGLRLLVVLLALLIASLV